MGSSKQCFRSVLGSCTYKFFACGAVLKLLNSLTLTGKVFSNQLNSQLSGIYGSISVVCAEGADLPVAPAFGPEVWTVKNRAAAANHLDHNIGVECPYFFVPYTPFS